jgi:hypothetical protein
MCLDFLKDMEGDKLRDNWTWRNSALSAPLGLFDCPNRAKFEPNFHGKSTPLFIQPSQHFFA